jgi:hypothetical protein
MFIYLVASFFLIIVCLLTVFGVWLLGDKQYYEIATLCWAMVLVLSVLFWKIFLKRWNLPKKAAVLIAAFPIIYGVLLAFLVVVFKQLMFFILSIALVFGAGYLWCIRRSVNNSDVNG